jgi:hypothetical protein
MSGATALPGDPRRVVQRDNRPRTHPRPRKGFVSTNGYELPRTNFGNGSDLWSDYAPKLSRTRTTTSTRTIGDNHDTQQGNES